MDQTPGGKVPEATSMRGPGAVWPSFSAPRRLNGVPPMYLEFGNGCAASVPHALGQHGPTPRSRMHGEAGRWC
jgi:hypothetical protein